MLLQHLFEIAVISVAWVQLCKSGELFDFVPKYIQKITKNQKINKVLYQCEKCLAGQLTFWTYFVQNYKSVWLPDLIFCCSFSILIAIWIGVLTNFIYAKYGH